MPVTTPEALGAEAIREALRGLPGWSGDERGLSRRLAFDDFRAAMRFMQACVEGIEQRNHHPRWTNTFSRVEIHLATHDAGDRVTSLDVDLARHIEDVLRDPGSAFGQLREG